MFDSKNMVYIRTILEAIKKITIYCMGTYSAYYLIVQKKCYNDRKLS